MTSRTDSLSAVGAALTHLGVSATNDRIERLALYAEEISRWNRRVNLTGAKTALQFIEGPLFDALTLMPVLAATGALVDVGSGGGLPGVPVAVLRPEISVSLVEPRARRTVFLRHIVHQLGLDAEVLECRSDDLAGRTWPAAVAQAVWEPGEWVRRSIELVRPGGAVYVLSSSEVTDADLPAHVKISARYHCNRPKDGVLKYSISLNF
jgi:16S rRNA (guanine527-N7)-methyltransferase